MVTTTTLFKDSWLVYKLGIYLFFIRVKITNHHLSRGLKLQLFRLWRIVIKVGVVKDNFEIFFLLMVHDWGAFNGGTPRRYLVSHS